MGPMTLKITKNSLVSDWIRFWLIVARIKGMSSLQNDTIDYGLFSLILDCHSILQHKVASIFWENMTAFTFYEKGLQKSVGLLTLKIIKNRHVLLNAFCYLLSVSFSSDELFDKVQECIVAHRTNSLQGTIKNLCSYH